MLPDTRESRAAFVEIRDYKSRWRSMRLSTMGGDWDRFCDYILRDLAFESECAGFLEVLDFAMGENMLTDEQTQSAMVALEALKRFRASMGQSDEVAA